MAVIAMDDQSSPDVTLLLREWQGGDQQALAALMPVVYDELRRLASRYLRGERRQLTIHTQDLVHEAFLRLIDERRIDWQGRAHFFAIAANTMRRVLVDQARSRATSKRGGDVRKIVLDDVAEVADSSGAGLVALDGALEELAAADAELAKIVELRFFGGLKNAEIGEVLGVSEVTVRRRFRLAKAWLYRYLRD